MPALRARTGLALVSLAVIGLELAFMRGLALRFWSHLAAMVVGVALLGFAAAGTALTLLRGRVLRDPWAWASALALALGACIPGAWWACQHVELDVAFLPWDLWQGLYVLLLELAMLVPFLLAGAVLGIALLDEPSRIAGHYAANLAGSGAGALAGVGAMFVLSTEQLVAALATAAAAGGLLLMPWRRRPRLGGALALAAGAALAAAWAWPVEPRLSPYSMLAQARSWPEVRLLAPREGPLGRIDVVAGPAIHHAPGLSLRYTQPLPPQALMILDADQAASVYDCRTREDWAFLDETTSAAAYHVLAATDDWRPGITKITETTETTKKEEKEHQEKAMRPPVAASQPSGPAVCLIGAGGGESIGLALFHRSRQVVALEMNPQVIDLMTDELAGCGGGIYRQPGVTVLNQEARGYFHSPGPAFDLVHLPPIDAFGASGAGRLASQECFLYTTQSLGAMLDRLQDGGILSITRWARTPPRDELRMFDIAAQALRRRGRDPAAHLAMLRNWATVTILAFRDPISPAQADALRRFCRDRWFDLCCLPGLTPAEVNQYHVLDRPHYFEAAQALLGPRRAEFLDNYLFAVEAVDDDRPYFFHSFRWRSLPVLAEQLRGTAPAFVEVGYLLAVAALVQALVLGGLLVLLPLLPRAAALRGQRGKAAAMGYFVLLGGGFMLLEMGLIQKLILCVASPIYSAAAVISGFLIFAGVGSALSGRWRAEPRRVMQIGGACAAAMAVLYLLVLDDYLRLAQPLAMGWRVAMVEAAILPLAVAMGHLFPAGVRQLGTAAPPLVPWAWAVNGFASVAATLAAPLAAMAIGFSRLILIAAACYALAALVARRLPE